MTSNRKRDKTDGGWGHFKPSRWGQGKPSLRALVLRDDLRLERALLEHVPTP